jgi:hypothetical protein
MVIVKSKPQRIQMPKLKTYFSPQSAQRKLKNKEVRSQNITAKVVASYGLGGAR